MLTVMQPARLSAAAGGYNLLLCSWITCQCWCAVQSGRSRIQGDLQQLAEVISRGLPGAGNLLAQEYVPIPRDLLLSRGKVRRLSTDS